MGELIDTGQVKLRSVTPKPIGSAVRRSAIACSSKACMGVYETQTMIPVKDKKVLIAFAIPEKYKDQVITITIEEIKKNDGYLLH